MFSNRPYSCRSESPSLEPKVVLSVKSHTVHPECNTGVTVEQKNAIHSHFIPYQIFLLFLFFILFEINLTQLMNKYLCCVLSRPAKLFVAC